MNDDDALPSEMRQRPGRREAPPTVDGETADRLLAGRLDPADAPPGYAGVAKLVVAATAPATAEELADEPEAVARFAATARSGFPARASSTRREGAPRRLLTVKAAAAVLAATLSVGGVAAAAGVFPAPARPAADHGRGGSGSGTATPGRGDAAVTTALSKVGNRERGNGAATAPPAIAPANQGLCRAWQAAQGKDKQKGEEDGDEPGKREDSTAFRALAAAAGGADKIAAYCQAIAPTDPPGRGDSNNNGDDEGGSSTDGG